MQITPLGYSISDAIQEFSVFDLKFLVEDYINSPFKTTLDKALVLSVLITDKKKDGTPLDDNAQFKILSALTYEEEVVLSLIHGLFSITFGLSGDEEPTIVLEADIFEDRTDLRITAMATVTADLTNFPTAATPFLRRMNFISDTTLQDLKDGKAVQLKLAESAADKNLKMELANFESTISLNSNFEFGIKSEAGICELSTPGPCQIGNTGFIVYFEKLGFTGKFPQFGLTVNEAIIVPPSSLKLGDGIPFPRITIQDGMINGNGISGKFSALWDLQYDEAQLATNPFAYKIGDDSYPASFFHVGDQALKGGLKKIELVFENNQLVSSDVVGQMLIPYFDLPIDFRLNFRSIDDFDVVLTSLTREGLILTKEHLLRLNITKIGINPGVGEITISGGLDPLLFSNEGMVWPRFDVKDLKINTRGQISIGEAWLDLKDLATLDLFGFHFELRKVGFGTENNSHLWIELAGGLRLIEQIPMGVDVEGFRIKWPQDLRLPAAFQPSDITELVSKLGIEFKGVQLTHAVPGVMKLDGLIRFFKDPNKVGFAGDMILDLPAAGFKAEAGLMVGMNNGNTPGDPDTSAFPFFYVYFGFEAAAGIPLGQSGLALKGALGMFGINVSPDKTPDQNWYYDWYKRGPFVGAHPTNKWKDERNAFAIGVGVTITSVDGFVKGTRGLLVLAIPGPILIIEGRALVLEGLKPADSSEPPLRALAVFDGKEKIVQFNIEAQLELVEDVVEAYAMLEAFFDFKDLTNWHLYLGQNEPRDRRIRANVLNILQADAYLMLDMLDADSIRARMGASVSMTPEIPDLTFEVAGQTIGIKFDAHIEIAADGEISLQPEQFQSKATLDAALDISALGFTFSISAYSELSVDGPSPLQIEAEVGYKLDFPDPIPDYQDSAHFKFEGPDVNITVKSPLSQVSLFHRFTAESKSAEIFTAFVNETSPVGIDSLSEQALAINSPVVYPDSQPVLAFEHDMNHSNGVKFLLNPGSAGRTYNVGRLLFKPTLTNIEIYERKKSAPWNEPWTLIYGSSLTGDKALAGAWLADGDTMSPNVVTARRLQLLTANALANTAHTNSHNGPLMNETELRAVHMADDIKRNHPDFLKCPPDLIPKTEIEFDLPQDVRILPNQPFDFRGVTINARGGFTIETKTKCLKSELGSLSMRFHRGVAEIVIEFCGKAEKAEATCNRLPTSSELVKRVKEDIDKKKKPSGFRCDIKVDVIIKKLSESSLSVKCKNAKEFLNCINLNSIPGIKKITITYLDDLAKNKAMAVICDVNGNLLKPGDISVFKPGCFYKIVTSTALEGAIDSAALSQMPEPLANILTAVYAEVLRIKNLADVKFTNISYYQTNTPPVFLERYIKWSYPYKQQSNFFGDNKMVLRFNRAYARKLFGDLQESPKHKLQFRIRDFRGNYTLIPRNNIRWSDARSATRFRDEETMDSIRPLTSGGSKDSLVTITKPSGYAFEPNQRYELIVHHDDAGPSLLSGESDIERNWQITNVWTMFALGGKNVGLQHTGTTEPFIMTGKDDWSNICISADINFLTGSKVGFVFRQKEQKLSQGTVNALYMVQFEIGNDFKATCRVLFQIKNETGVIETITVKISDTFTLNSTGGFARLSMHILGNTLKAGTSETTVLEVSENELNLLHSNLTPTDLHTAFKTPLSNGKAGLFVQSTANSTVVQFKNIQVNQSDLLTIPFIAGPATSARTLFAGKPAPGQNRSVTHRLLNAAWKADMAVVNTQMQNFLAAEMRLFKMGVDLEYGICKVTSGNRVLTSQEAFEKGKSDYLDSRKVLDATFNSMMQKLNPEVLFAPAPKRTLESKVILTSDNKVEAIVLHSPQNLDLQSPVNGSDNLFASRGRLKINSLKINGQPIASFSTIFNPDMNLVLIVPGVSVNTRVANNLAILGNYTNFTDDTVTAANAPFNTHHRYDRIVEEPGTPISVTYEAQFGREG